MKKLVAISAILLIGSVIILSFKTEATKVDHHSTSPKDSVGSVKAFMSVYKVLMSARCMNCHPSGDVPLQGDDSHLHAMNIKRGVDGHGLYAVRCSNCHQAENTRGLHMPPGNPKWGLPPADMRMVFQGRTPRELALQLLDPKQNGGKSYHDLVEHMKTGLVKWGWHPGEGRTPIPLPESEFLAKVNEWASHGAACPAETI